MLAKAVGDTLADVVTTLVVVPKWSPKLMGVAVGTDSGDTLVFAEAD